METLWDLAERQAREDITRNRHRGNQESQEAFLSIRDTLSRRCEEVLSYIKTQGLHGATTDEVARAFGCTPNQVSGRLSDLKKAMKIKATDKRRPTSTGHMARVFIAV